jgi:hypothetical protein
MIGKQKEKWMELCELAANEQDANNDDSTHHGDYPRLGGQAVKQQRLDPSNPGSKG